MRVLLGLVILYLLLAVAVMLGQRRLIYYPSRFSEATGLTLAASGGLQPWRDGDGKLIGWHIPSRGPSTGAALIVHGNAGSAVDRGYIAQPLHDGTSLDVYILEYPGYGAREGSPSLSSFNAAAEQAVRALPTNLAIYVVSESLGTGAAAHIARTFPDRVRGLAMFVPYDKLTSVAQHQMRFLPAALLLRDRFAPSDWLKAYHGPIVFTVAGNDTVIPPRFGRRLHDSYAGPKKLQFIEGAGHNDVAALTPTMWQEIAAFWASHPL